MATTWRPRAVVGHPVTSPSPLRHASTASSNSSASGPPSRTSTVSSRESNSYNLIIGQTRHQIDAGRDRIAEKNEHDSFRSQQMPSLAPSPSSSSSSPPPAPPPKDDVYQSMRDNLRPTTQRSKTDQNEITPVSNSRNFHHRSHSTDNALSSRTHGSNSPPAKARPLSMALSRSDSVRVNNNQAHFNSQLEKPELKQFTRSSTGHLRTLSRFAEDGAGADFTIKSPDQEVVGLHGRRRLQRGDSMRAKNSQSGWAGRTWMDQQRQYLQAYEYLCHIGEAKEWIEDIIQRPIPPIVKLEEALRDGVTLAEVVQSLYPNRNFRIFRSQTLNFRHSDNIAIFFRFLDEVELPDLFWFELVDLYEKKNIPKVIYCIHALSWLLWRKGIVDFRIGNLVGQLQFEDHELEAMQKGLDRAGINMPNFSGMGANFGAEPEPEPVETEDERIQRELSENGEALAELQAQMRGALVRLRLGDDMQSLWDVEGWLVELQSKIRGDFSREIYHYRLDMKNFAVNLQSRTRGFLLRNRMANEVYYWKNQEHQVILLQSLLRGRKARERTQTMRTRVQHQASGIRDFQAAVRGAITRKRTEDEVHQVYSQENKVKVLQSLVRGMLQRRVMQTDRTSLRTEEKLIEKLQAAARASLARKENNSVHGELKANEPRFESLQSTMRGFLLRQSLHRLRKDLNSLNGLFTALEACTRGYQSRQRLARLREDLARQNPSLLLFQSAARGFALRQHTFELLCEINEHEKGITSLQSISRAILCRSRIGQLLMELEKHEESIIGLQTWARGGIVRTNFEEKMRFYKENMEKVIKVQSFIRGRQQGEAYKILTSGKNPPVGTVKNFVHLLNDSDFDFDEEIEFERLRKTVVQHVRQNELAEQYIDQLDIKIALLVKNKITLDEVVRHQKHFGGNFGAMLGNKDFTSKDPFNLKALNKNSRKKLEHYQELFFILQTQPQYLARLFKRLREKALPEPESKKIELLFMGLFGFAQKRREEYYLLKLMARSIKEEIDASESIQSYVRGNFFWSKLLSGYIRSPRDRKYLKDLLGPLVREDVVQSDDLDLESDPIQIYRSAINNEELRTGQRSRRPTDIPREEAIRDPETRQTFIQHLQDLRDIADHFLMCLEDTLQKMPYGIRFLAQQTFELLCIRFPHEPRQHLLTIVGQWIWKTYVQPALLQPDTWGVIDRGLSPMQKRNLGEVSKVVGQIAAGRLFGGENVYLQPINPYISEALARIEDIWTSLIDVPEAEAHFDIDEFNDLYARTKPTLYIKLTDIFAIHQLVTQDIAALCPGQDDILREVVRELGSAKNNENDMLHVSSTEITLTLNTKFHDVEDPDAAVKALFMETKRCVLYIIRIQAGSNLLDIMIRPISVEDEDRWAKLVHDELKQQHKDPKKRNPYHDGSSLLDIASMAYTELKRTTLENILTLEKTGRISRANHYQEILNAIALDIRSKHRRRIQRSREMDNVRATLKALQEKAVWLESQLKSYNDYIEQAMVTLQQKAKGKKRFLLPFSRQYNHERELARNGRVPKFGSFKYSARNLADKGVLVSWRGYTERQWDRINITISSDAVGIFHFEGSAGSLMIPGASASVPLDNLLQAQFNNCQFMNIFGADDSQGDKEGPLRLNVNLLVHLLMKKFYSQA